MIDNGHDKQLLMGCMSKGGSLTLYPVQHTAYACVHMAMEYTEAADNAACSAPFQRKSPTEFLALSEAVSCSSQGIIPRGLNFYGTLLSVFSSAWGPITAMVQIYNKVGCSVCNRNSL